jgi:hypothetical protein
MFALRPTRCRYINLNIKKKDFEWRAQMLDMFSNYKNSSFFKKKVIHLFGISHFLKQLV